MSVLFYLKETIYLCILHTHTYDVDEDTTWLLGGSYSRSNKKTLSMYIYYIFLFCHEQKPKVSDQLLSLEVTV